MFSIGCIAVLLLGHFRVYGFRLTFRGALASFRSAGKTFSKNNSRVKSLHGF